MDVPSSPAPEPVASDRFGWRAQRRGTPWLGHAVAGGAGTLIGIGLISIGIDAYPDGSDDPGIVGALLCLALVVVSFVALTRLPTALRAAAVACIAIGIAGAFIFLIFPGIDRVEDLRAFWLLTIAAYLIAFFVPPTRGRILFLGLALYLAFNWATIEVADLPSSESIFFPGITSSIGGSSDSGFSTPNDTFTFDDGTSGFDDQGGFAEVGPREPNWGQIGGVAAIFGIGYLLAVALLDARRRNGLATAFVFPGVIALVYAIVFLGVESDNVLVAGVLSVAAGLFCGSVGTQGQRRFTVWFGAFFATVGALLIAGKVATDATNDSGDNAGYIFGAFTIGFGVIMAAVALFVARLLHEPPHGDDDEPEPTPVAPAPTPTATTPYF